MRKFVMAAVACLFTFGLALAAEVTFVKFDKDKKELTVKDDKDKEVTYKITDSTKFLFTDKDGNQKEMKVEKGIERLEKDKDRKKAPKYDIEVDKDKKSIKELKFKGGKKP
jgi:hypothetical protein